MFLIVVGSEVKNKIIDSGQFFCPNCQARREYKKLSSKRYVTVYFLPIFPTEDLGVAIECQTCGTHFPEDVLKQKMFRNPANPNDIHIEINQRLAMGEPAERIIRDAVLAGVERESALETVQSMLGSEYKVCETCALTYSSNTTNCTDCGNTLQNKET